MKISHFPRILSIGFAFLVAADPAAAYQLENIFWPPGTNVVMHLGLGPAGFALQDGMASWDASAADAVDIWNGHIDFISMSSVTSPTVPQVSGDGVNSVFFAGTIFGDTFGESTLAVTVLLPVEGSPAWSDEADVIVNNAFQFDSYRGPLQTRDDIHRIFLHEFGHVLGLAHVTNDPPGQALMEPYISDLDHLAFDDILGMRRTYGAIIYSSLGDDPVILRVGDSFVFSVSDLYPTNSPTSYSVVGLPPGIIFDPVAGEIIGSATASGVFGSVIIAHGPIADAYATLPFTVLGLERVQGLLKILATPGFSMVADPIRPRIYKGSFEGLQMIDTSSFTVTNLLTEDDSVSNLSLSLSADSSLLLFTRATESPPQLNRIDLESLALLPPLPIPANSSAVREGLENRDYVSDSTGVFQFDRTTGELQTFFAPTGLTSGTPAEITLSPDRKTLYIASVYGNGLLSYDVSGAEPLPLQSIPGIFRRPIPSPDGQYLYYRTGESEGADQVFQAQLPGLSPMIFFADSSFYTEMAVGLDGSIYKASGFLGPTLSTFALYDPISLQPTANVDVNRFDPSVSYVPGSAVFDGSGKYLFVSIGAVSPQIWVFSTDLASFPPPPPDPTKNLLNISTRARVESGENAMIGGFIVQGPDPKRVLIRGLGPSLPLNATLGNPALELYDASGKLLASNDDWISDRIDILASQVAPTNERESALSMTLQPGAYTAVVHDKSDQPGLALVEVYDLDPADSVLANISTRGKVETADDVMIGGFIIGGLDSTKVLVRAIGPSLAASGVQQPLADPILELHDSTGKLISTNDDWRATQESEIVATGIPPTDDRESAILTTLQPGSYTAIVRGQGSTTGVALVEVYNLEGASAGSK